MDRSIKFRAWFPKDHWIAEKYGQMIEDYTSKTLFEITGFWEDNVVYMQYTDLKDKNGQEIYEGDIIEDFYHKGVVKFGEATYDSGYYKTQGFYIDLMDDGSNDGTSGLLFDNKIEIIGNIYENPELLDDE